MPIIVVEKHREFTPEEKILLSEAKEALEDFETLTGIQTLMRIGTKQREKVKW
jgi:hypothetical protein